ncbi:hypothetical protein STAQ_41330 [Allostella sp. ATCC 35155]|nr:hypothetical protein STAQ_41330 [Stella sp. ATCC 35155]
MRALVVDDVPEIRELISVLLSGDGFRVEAVAESAEEAFERLYLDDPAVPPPVDVILLDVMLPGVDGIAACGRIKSDPRYRDIPILMVTARQETASLQQAFAAGAADYIRKPVQKSELLARVRSCLRRRSESERRMAGRPEGARAVDRLLLPGRDLIEATLAAAAEAGRCAPMAVAAIRIDDWEGLRERRGRAAADAATGALAERLARQPAALGDLLAHDGEGRLLALLRRTQAPEAAQRVAGWIADAADGEAGNGEAEDGLAVSAGLAWCPGDTPDGLKLLVERALAALTTAGNAGGRRLEIA